MRRRTATLLCVLAAIPGCSRRAETPSSPPPPLTRVVLGGDVMLSRYVGKLARQRNDPAWPFRKLAPFLAAADIAFINLESPFSDRGKPADKGMVFKADPALVQGLQLAGIDVVSTANNHARDQGSHGLEFTLDWLEKHGILAVGTSKDARSAGPGAVLERNGLRFGFLAYTYDQSNGNHPSPDGRIAMLDVGRMRQDVVSLLARADIVIVSMHAGQEYRTKPDPRQVEFARAAIDAGASVVAGHHPHVVQPTERYRNGVIFYSLGNLVFDQFHRQDTQQGLLGEVTFRGAAVEGMRAIPVRLNRTAPEL